MFINGDKLLQNALKEEYAIGAYNINELECIKIILESCNEDKSPVIIQFTPLKSRNFGGFDLIHNKVKSIIRESNIKVPVILELLDAKSFDECKEAIDYGFTSVMIDVSDKNIDDAINIATLVVNYAKKNNVSVGAKFGASVNDAYNDDEYLAFVSATQINYLLPVLCDKQILLKEKNIDFDFLGHLSRIIKIPLVLYYESFLDENKIKAAIFCGVSKINIDINTKITKDLIREKNTLLCCKNKAN